MSEVQGIIVTDLPDIPDKPGISYSRMTTFLTCPQKYYRQYILKERRPEYPALKFGSAVHKWLENYLAGTPVELTTNDLPYIKDKDHEQVQAEFDLAKTLCDKALDTLLKIDDFGISDFDSIDFIVEEKFAIDIGVAIFNGFIDLSFTNDRGEIFIIDWKTTSAEYTKHQIKSSKQLTGYAYAYWRLHGIIPDKVCYITLNKKTEQVKVYYDTRTEDDLKEIECQLQQTALAIQQNLTYRNPDGCNLHGWKCEYFSQCWRGDDPVILNMEERGIASFKRPTV